MQYIYSLLNCQSGDTYIQKKKSNTSNCSSKPPEQAYLHSQTDCPLNNSIGGLYVSQLIFDVEYAKLEKNLPVYLKIGS